MQDYGKALRTLRRHYNLTQKELADKLNVTSQTVSKWENGVNRIDITYLRDITALFAISIDQFIRISEGQSLELVLNSSTHVDEPETPTVETDLSLETNPSPDPAFTAENATPTTVNTAVNPNISPNERVKSFFKTNLHGIISAIVLFIIAVALTITTICVTNPTLSATQIYERVNPSVFYIEVDTAEGKQAGSGFFIDKNGTAVTNYHVIKGGSNAKVTLPDGNKYDVESILGCDSVRDLVLLKVNINRSVPVQQGNSNNLKTGDKVYAIGYPQSFIIGAEDSTFTDGIISKSTYNIDGVNYIQTTADITNGNSGGVLIDSKGRVVGITTGKIDIGGVSYMNLALPVNNIGNIKSNINLPLSQFSSKYKDVTVTYMAGDEVYSKKTVTNGTKIPRSSGERHGYIFEGWFKDSELLTPFDFNTPVDGDVTIYGKWTPITYTMVFEPNGGIGEPLRISAMFGESTIMPECTFTYQGKGFVGWRNTNLYKAGESVENNFTYVNGDEVVFKAEWGKPTYTLTFDGDGADTSYIPLSDYKDCQHDTSVLLPISPTRDGYNFMGWSLNGKTYSAEESVNITEIAGDNKIINFKALWEAKEYTVHYIVYYGQDEVVEEQRTYKVGEKFNLLTVIEALPAGYRLRYWYGGDIYSLGQVVSSEDFGYYDENEYLYGECTAITYYVDCQDSITGKSYGRITATYAEKVNFDSLYNKPYKQGYRYSWQLYNDDGTPYTGEEGKITTTSGKTVIAKTVYSLISYNVTFWNNSKHIATITLNYDEEFILPEEYCIAEKGYTFLYYKKYNTDVEYYVAGSVIKNLSINDGESIRLRAYHQENNFSIAFDPNGGSGEMPVQSAICEHINYINKNTFEREGYYFTGWKYGEEEYSNGGIIRMYVDEGTVITLVAQWTETLEGDGTELSPFKVASYDDLVKMSDMVEKSLPLSKAYYVLTADIDCKNQSIKPIGGWQHSFKGTFDGQNHEISNLKIEQADYMYMGLFGNVYFGALKNFGLKNYTMTDASTATYYGAIAGKYLSDKPIENVYAKGETNLTINVGHSNSLSAVYVGGMFGILFGSASNCYYEGKVVSKTTGRYLITNITTGGFAGTISDTSCDYDGVNYVISPNISCCYVYSKVTVNSSNGAYINYKMGGFVGEIVSTKTKQVAFEYCVSIGDVKSINGSDSGYYGGFAGVNTSKVNLTLVRRDSKSVCEGSGTHCAVVSKEDILRLQNVQWLINEFGFSADIWADEYGLPMLKAFIKETL